MKTQKLILSWVCLIFLLASCEKDEETPAVIPDLSTDSLRILQANIPGNHYTDLIFINESLGFAISNSGEIIKTINGGYDWEELDSPVNFFLSKIQFTDSKTGYIIGGDTTGGYLLQTTSSGQTWQLTDLQTPGKKRPSGMFFLNNTTGFISGEKLFRKTTDGGHTWSEVLSSVSQDINDICFKNSREGYAVSDS